MSYPGYPQQPQYPHGAYPQQPGYPQQPVGYGAPMPGYAPAPGYAPQPFAAPMAMGGGFNIVSRLNNLAIDVKGGDRSPGAHLILWNKKDSGSANQIFRLTPEGYIQNVETGLVLDINGGGQPGAKIIMYHKKPLHEARNQLWRYDPSCEVFESHVPGLVLDIDGGNHAPGTHLIAWNRKAPHDNTNQRFFLAPQGQGAYPSQPGYPQPQPGYPMAPVVPGYGAPVYGAPIGGRPFCIRSRLNGKVLDVKGGDKTPGAHVIVWDHHGGANQRWTMTPDGFIQNVATGFALDILGGARQGNKIGVYHKKQPHEDASNQRWRYDPSTETIISYAGSLVLDIEGGSSAAGAHVIAWTPNAPHSNQNQRWTVDYC